MSYNSNFYNNFPNDFTFRNPPPLDIPPPPLPPPFLVPPIPVPNFEKTDQEFVRQFEKGQLDTKLSKENTISISTLKEKLQNLVLTLNSLKDKQKMLSENITILSDSDWSKTMEDIEQNKAKIDQTMGEITVNLDMLRQLLAKRAAKRLRMKRVQKEYKEERKKLMEEQSRKINENLQKIKDDILKAKQEEEAKLKADMVLKEVLRKKHDAKKYLVKLDAMIKLRRARFNTAKGRGEHVTERDADVFNSNIEKLKRLWIDKLALYEKEEIELRATLTQDSENEERSHQEQKILRNLDGWKKFLFGGELPQVDFKGDKEGFVQVRREWDQYISAEGSPLPIGWVVPTLE